MRVLFSVITFRRVLLYDNVYGITLFAHLQANTPKSLQNPSRIPAASASFPGLQRKATPFLFLRSCSFCLARRTRRHNPKLPKPVF
jgi:hypothetical protein